MTEILFFKSIMKNQRYFNCLKSTNYDHIQFRNCSEELAVIPQNKGWCDGAEYFQYQWLIVGQEPFANAVGAGGGCLDIFSRLSFVFLHLLEAARYRLKYCLKGPLNLKQPTNQAHNKIFSW